MERQRRVMSERIKPREYEVYYESELSLGIAIGPEVVPPGAKLFRVREVLPESEWEGTYWRHRENIASQRLERAEKNIAKMDAKISFLLGEIKEALDFIPENCSAARLLTDALLDEVVDE